MAKQHQRPKELEQCIQAIMTPEDKILLRSAHVLPLDEASGCARRLCDVLLRYCSYRLAPAECAVDPFDDPFVGAALITNEGEVLGAHRKEGRNEPHAEVETLLGTIDRVSCDEAAKLGSAIREGLQTKVWLTSAAAESGFVRLFEQAGNVVRNCYGKRLILLSTLEPCRDFESQPSCSRLISAFAPDVVIYGCDDTNAKGQGRPVLVEHGIHVIANASYELNVEINLLFYAAVHYLTRLHSAALESQSRFETSYVVANLNRLQPMLSLGDDTRLRLHFDHGVKLPVHRAPVELRAPQTDDPLPKAVDPDRVLFINAIARDFLSLYFHRHFATTNRIPGIVVCSQSATREGITERAEDSEAFLAKLRDAGVRIYTNVLRKSDEKFLALHSIFRLDQSVAAEGNLYVFVKEDDDRYSHQSGKAHQIADYLRSLGSPRRVTIYYGRDAAKSVRAMVSELKGSRAFEEGSPLSRSSFQTFVVARDEMDAKGAADELRNWLHHQNLSNRFFVGQQTQKSVELRSAEVLHELISGRFDPIAQDGWWLEGMVNGATWKDRQAAGLFLSGAARRDPVLYCELIASKIPDTFEAEHWREIASLLNAVAKYKRPVHPGDWHAVERGLVGLSAGFEEVIGRGAPPQLLDVVWRYIAACLSVAESPDEVNQFLSGKRLLRYIGGSPFLLKELFFYANRPPAGRDEAIRRAFDILTEYAPSLAPAALASVALRVTRLSTLWDPLTGEGAREQLRRVLANFPAIDSECEAELGRCRFVLEHRLAGVFTKGGEDARLFSTYLFLRTAESGVAAEGLFSAVGREIDQAVSRPQSGKVPVSWRGERTSLARLALSEVPTDRALSFLTAMAEDEDDPIRWAALVLAMDFDFRRKLLGASPTKALCLAVRSKVAVVLFKGLATDPHYWLKREFISLFRTDHAQAQEDESNGTLPLLARLQVGDVPGARTLLCGDGAGEHPEVVDELQRLKTQMRRIVLVLPPVDRDEARTAPFSRSTTPPLGLGSIASYLLCHGHDVELLDCHRFPELTNALVEVARGRDVIGFNVVTSSFRATELLVAELRRALRERTPKVVLGGHAVTLHPNEFLEHRRFDWDYLVLGDGEVPLLKIVQSLNNQESSQIPGVISRVTALPIPPASMLTAKEWDELPWVDHGVYRDPSGTLYEPALSRNGNSREGHIVMSRGCAWKCSFCTEAILRGKAGEIRRSAADVLNEIRHLVEHAGVDRIQFIDDNLLPQIAARGTQVNDALEWTDVLLTGLHDLAIRTRDFGWRGIFRFEDFVKYEQLLPQWIDRLLESRCLLLAFGVEHGSEERRKQLKGGSVTNDEIKRVVGSLKAKGIATKGYFIVGGTGEDQHSTSESIDLAISSGFTLAYFALFKNFRELIKRSNAGHGTVDDRERTFMRFRNLLADFDDRIEQLRSPEDCVEAFGMPFDIDTIAAAKASVRQLALSGFSFRDLFKYNDFHDNLDEVNDSVLVWSGTGNGSPARTFLQAVRRAYFQFYGRPEFVENYRWLVDRGY